MKKKDFKDKEDFLKTIKESIAKSLDINIDKIKDDSKLRDDFGAGYLDMHYVIYNLEKEIETTVQDEDILKWEDYTVKEIANDIWEEYFY